MVKYSKSHILIFIIVTILLFFYYKYTNQNMVKVTIISDEFQLIKNLKPFKNTKNKLFDIEPFVYKTSPENCTTDIFALILVTSYIGNVEIRSVMRKTFTNDNLREMNLKRVFLLGEELDLVQQNAIIDENRRFNDILQGNFKEAYRNLTYKHLMGLKYASESCNDVKYVIKMDDDIVLNLERIVKLLKTAIWPKNLIAGYILKNLAVIREPANKWFVTTDEYKQTIYPTFVSGWFYITTPQLCAKFVLLANYEKYFWIDDVYITGILARYLRIKHFDLGKYFSVHSEFLECCIKDASNFIDCDLLIGPNSGDNQLFFKFNQGMHVCNEGNCRKRDKSLNDTCVTEKRFHLGKGNAFVENYKLH